MTAEKAAAATPPDRIGPYHILDVIGEGGMGTVYHAEQREPVRRRVALKVIKLGMDSKAVLARFDAERQALSMMEHSCVARIFDAGISADGRPYFAMEYVKGIPLTEYCDRNKLSLPDRIALFQQVCSAVQHAHQKGVIHRDLKPSNVLVSEEQGKPKVIDFGLARATDHMLLQQTMFTELGHVVGTPEYMSPEQADPTTADIDTRTDIYSLGIVLYELLTGTVPFGKQRLQQAGMLEMQRVIREEEPQKPSTKVTSFDAASTDALAAKRRTTGRALGRALKHDLDWIVLKAIDKDRNRRYESAAGLALDLGRYLAHEPVTAGPPSAGYRLKKVLRRYRGQFIAGALVFATAVVGAVVAIGYAFDAEAQAKEKEKERAEARRQEGIAVDKAAEALARKSEFDQLAGVVLHERAVKTEEKLYPAWPENIEAMATWLRDDCGKLLAMQPQIERTVNDLRARALPWTEEEKAADRKLHPKFPAWELLSKQAGALRRAQAIRAGKEKIELPELPAEVQKQTANALNTLAWDRAAPKADERKVYGEEAFGLACAQAALARVAAGDTTAQKHALLDTLAWALLSNGRDGEAQLQSDAALAAAPATDQDNYSPLRGIDEVP